jgi:hypothetical protein
MSNVARAHTLMPLSVLLPNPVLDALLLCVVDDDAAVVTAG